MSCLRAPALARAALTRAFASDCRKKGGALSKRLPRNGTNVLNDSNVGLQSSIPPKIVQIRTKTTQNLAATAPATPPQSPSPPSSTPPSSPPPKPPKNEEPSDKSTTRNIFIGLLIAAASLGGIYYAGIFDKNEKTEKKTGTSKDKKKGSPREVKRYPASKEDFPAKIPYVLIGGGTASFAAFRAIKSKDPTAKVLVISAEDSIPYMRPPLSKEVWQRKDLPPIDKLTFMQWNGQERSLYYEPSDFYMNIQDLEAASNGGVVVASGWVASKVDPISNTVTLEDPKTNSDISIEYGKCLIATGSTPKNLPIFEHAPNDVKQRTVLYRNIRDLENLWYKIENAKSVAIVGGGFLGSELACSLGRRFKDTPGSKVYQMFKEPGNMGRILPEYLSKWTTERVVGEGVNVIPSAEVQVVQMDGKQVLLNLSNGKNVHADVVIVAVGSEPCTQLAEDSFLEVDPNIGGYLVNAELEARTNIYVAGDAACFYDPILGRRRVEHHDHAVVSGRLAGENMAGSAKPYKHQSMFWSDLGPDVGYEAIGVVEAELPTVAVFAKMTEAEKAAKAAISKDDENHKTAISTEDEVNVNALSNSAEDVKSLDKNEVGEVTTITDEKPKSEQDLSKGVIFYLKNEKVVGIVLWNVFNKMHIARQVLAERRKYDDLNEVAKLFNLHDD